MRCVNEASLYDSNCFLTLTYNDDALVNLPRFVDTETGEITASLNKRDVVLFLKRLRKRFGSGIRFFQCGEYGSLFSRPHHHVLVFNFDFPDKFDAVKSKGVVLYRSYALEELWPYGFSRIGELTFDSAAYVARYIMKKITGDKAAEYYGGLLPEYITMSRRPGIARRWIETFLFDVYPQDVVISRELKLRPPRYYDSIYDSLYPDSFAEIKEARLMRSVAKKQDNSLSRRMIKEEVLRMNLKFKRRSIE